jgi:Immunity protein 61
MTEPQSFSAEFLDWARRAGYALTAADGSGAAVLWSDPGGEIRYQVRRQDDGWYLLTRSSRGGDEQFTLRAVSIDVLERYLWGVFGSVVRDSQRLPFMRKPWAADDIADGYTLSDMSEDGYRTLTRAGEGPIAIASESTTSLIYLVPLSHFLGLSIPELKDSFLSETGAPLMSGDRYARVRNR